jgi:hypothetical protein
MCKETDANNAILVVLFSFFLVIFPKIDLFLKIVIKMLKKNKKS